MYAYYLFKKIENRREAGREGGRERDRQTQRRIFHPLSHWPEGCSSWGLVKAKAISLEHHQGLICSFEIQVIRGRAWVYKFSNLLELQLWGWGEILNSHFDCHSPWSIDHPFSINWLRCVPYFGTLQRRQLNNMIYTIILIV